MNRSVFTLVAGLALAACAPEAPSLGEPPAPTIRYYRWLAGTRDTASPGDVAVPVGSPTWVEVSGFAPRRQTLRVNGAEASALGAAGAEDPRCANAAVPALGLCVLGDALDTALVSVTPAREGDFRLEVVEDGRVVVSETIRARRVVRFADAVRFADGAGAPAVERRVGPDGAESLHVRANGRPIAFDVRPESADGRSVFTWAGSLRPAFENVAASAPTPPTLVVRGPLEDSERGVVRIGAAALVLVDAFDRRP